MGEHKLPPHIRAQLPGRLMQPALRPVNITTGHNDDHVVVSFTEKIDHITFTLPQAKNHLEMLQKVVEHFEQHLAQKKLDTLTVEGSPPAAANEVQP